VNRAGVEGYQERREQLLALGREQLQACPHGRKRVTFGEGPSLKGGLECVAGKCAFAPVSMAQVLKEWKTGQPVSPADDGA